jgi:uncharacterized protein
MSIQSAGIRNWQRAGLFIAALASGLIFGLGMAISGMTNTSRVQGFLDITGQWDPTLIFVMAGGIVVTFLGYKYILQTPSPMFAASFSVPGRKDIDKPLVIGATIFGIGWGLVGYCPGPALAGLSYGYWVTSIFVATMITGLLLAPVFSKLLQR